MKRLGTAKAQGSNALELRAPSVPGTLLSPLLRWCLLASSRAILSGMRRTVTTLLLTMSLSANAFGQIAWSLPKLKELDQSDSIAKGSIQLSVGELGILRQTTRHAVSACVADPYPGDPTTPNGVFRTLRVARVNLGIQGESALVVQGNGACMCGASGNCPFWLLSEGPGSKLLLRAEGVQSFSVQRAKSGGPFDLVLGSHHSAMETDIQRFRFSGNAYKLAACATIEWDGYNLSRLVTPRIIPERCP